MKLDKKSLLSIGAAIASTKLAQMFASLELDDVLRPVGLSRRHRSWPGNLVFLGAGILVGGVGALLLAPNSGQQTRLRLAKKAGELGEGAVRRAREIGQEILDDEGLASPSRENGGARSPLEPT